MTRTLTYVKACIMLGLLTVGAGVHAQERTAGSTTDLQMTWSTLKNLIDSVKTQTEAVSSRVDQVVLCGKKGLTYAPSVVGADANGCYDPHTPGGVALTTIANDITTLTTTTQTNSNNITSIINCNKQSKVYNGTACVTPTSSSTTKVDLNACVYFPWIHAEQDISCPTNHVLAKMRSHKTDSQEWAGFYCCPLI